MDDSLPASATLSYSPKPNFDKSAITTQCKPAFPVGRFVPQLVSAQAIQNPGHIALVDHFTRLTYGELDHQATQLAHQLQTMGVAADVLVAVCMRRSPLAVIAALAILKAGGAYLPIDPSYPRERLSFILTDAEAHLLLSESTVAGILPHGNWRAILMDGKNAIGKLSADCLPTQICSDHLSYVIYTSGSTGAPKGVEITHKNLMNLVSWHQHAFAVTAEDRGTQFTSFGFDAAVAELWPYLTAGATVHITPEEIRSSPELLRDWLVDQQITITFVPTLMAEQLIMLDWPLATSLRFLLTGADTLHHYPRPGLPFVLVNNYGPTETTVVATAGPVASERNHFEQRPSIGRPIDGAEIYIVDDSLNLVHRGEVGEICIGGAGVGRGYVKSPELTAKKFVPDPFVKTPDGRIYRTGDLGRWLPDGQIEYLGRVDDMLKIRGYRVEPNEIIAVLNTHPAVQASAVIQREDRLVAYLMMKRGEFPPTATHLRDLLRDRLPEYMIPTLFVVMPELPLTTNGKVDREALPQPDGSNTLQNDNYISPRTVLEEKLSGLVSGLLGVNRVGVDDNFFLIGGHSLFGTQLIARIRDSFGVELPLRSVFEAPTVAALGVEIERLMVTRINAMSDDEVQHALRAAGSRGD